MLDSQRTHRLGTLRRAGGGFTLIEALLVVVLITLIALIVIPRFIGASTKSRESALRSDLHELRTAIQRFEADTGAYPPALADLMATNAVNISADADGRGISVDKDGYHGPYLTTGDDLLPKDAITRAVDWDYSNVTGAVHSSSPLRATDDSFYAEW